MTPYLMVVFCVVSLAGGQILFKAVSQQIETLPGIFTSWSAALTFAAAIALYGASTLVWILALRTLPLSRAYPFMALGFILVPLAGYFLFKENLTIYQVAGIGLVVAGLLVTCIDP